LKELSIFIDESGDFGEYDYHSPYYIITMVFHRQDVDIQSAINKLNIELGYLGLNNLCIHTGPIIRREEIYFYIEKRHMFDIVTATGKLSKLISQFICEHYEELLSFNNVKIYYDNGQVEVSKILSSVFNALLPNSIFRKVMPTDYKLLQVADLFCSMELVKLKLEHNLLSKSEKLFFGNLRDLKKNYLKPISKKEWV